MKLRLEVLSPVTISCSYTSINEIYTVDYIPATVVRGVLASAYIKEKGISDPMQDNLFKEIFLSGKCIFGNLYYNESELLPLSALSCKYSSGFVPDAHGVKDMVIPWLKNDMEGLEYCSQCKAPMDNFRGFYKKEKGYFKKIEVPKRLIARTAINPTRETAAHGELFSMEAINEGSFFAGRLHVENGLKDKVLEFLNSREMRIGTARSRGQGHCKVFVENKSSTDNLNERFDRFNCLIGDKHTYFSITLLSDMIIFDKYLRYCSKLTLDTLLEYLSVDSNILNNFKLDFWISGTRKISGWNSAPNVSLPKEDVVTIEKGSVFVFKSSNSLSDEVKTQIASELQKIPEFIGERVTEGFGQVSICNKFHLEFYEEMKE
ncbi:MAG: RAMP superfamily CRISPR-associated protein [Nitrospirota bacterium]|nr:RAMP superfamily CRISPR-associated protein [Nitrospirota bacterium]